MCVIKRTLKLENYEKLFRSPQLENEINYIE